MPPQTAKTIGDTLSAKGISWAWYAGGWNAALADGKQPAGVKRKVIYTRDEGSPNFQPHHQPFNYHARFAPGTPDRAEHLKSLLRGLCADGCALFGGADRCQGRLCLGNASRPHNCH